MNGQPADLAALAVAQVLAIEADPRGATTDDLDALVANYNALDEPGRARVAAASPEFGRMVRRVVEQRVLAMASFVGEMTLSGQLNYELFERDRDAFGRRLDALADDSSQPAGVRVQGVDMAVMTAAWFENGLPRVNLGHRHAASLMCTRVPADVLADLHLPWPAFMADVPLGLLEHRFEDGRVAPIAHVMVHAFAPGHYRIFAGTPAEGALWLRGPHLARLAADMEAEGSAVATMIARFALGVALEMTAHRPSGATARGPAAVRRDRDGNPRPWVFKLTRDVRVDCRDVVREAGRAIANGSRLPPTVRALVRGHWKWQPCGERRADRKYIAIDPYWRGDPDAPVALRSHVLGATRPGTAEGEAK